jgi:hypothetical protein
VVNVIRRLRFEHFAPVFALLVFAGLPRRNAQDVPDCVDVWGEARYRNYGYDHLVHVANHCAEPVRCDVWTSVNPARISVTVAAHDSKEVLTFRGSPAREFVPGAECDVLLEE